MLCLRAAGEGMPHDTRIQEFISERSQQSPLPLPEKVSFCDVIGNDCDAFHDENHTHKEGTHAFFMKLGGKTAVVLGYENRHNVSGPEEIQFRGQMLRLGPLLRGPENALLGSLWIWEVNLPPTAVPLVREREELPLILWKDEMTILTAEGPKQAVLADRYFSGPYLPGHVVEDHSSLELVDGAAYNAIRIGDPVIQTSTGIVVAAVTNKIPESKTIDSPADCWIAWISFPQAKKKLSAPLTDVWGAAVPSNASLDEAFVQRFMPVRALETKIGETIEQAWERNPFLHRLPEEAKNRWSSVDHFGEEWVFDRYEVDAEEGRVVGISTKTDSKGSKTTLACIDWLAEKFQAPKELRKSAKGDGLLSIWNEGPIWVAATFGLSLNDKNMSIAIRVASEEAQLKERFNQDAYSVSVPETPDKNTFLSLARALASKAVEEDFVMPHKLALRNPVSSASSGPAVMKRNGVDIQMNSSARPAAAPQTKATSADEPVRPTVSGTRMEIRKRALQKLEVLGQVAEAYNALPEDSRRAAKAHGVSGAFELLQTHADRHPHLVLSEDLRLIMEWALMLSETGELQGSPGLQTFVQVIQSEIVVEKARVCAQQMASIFAAAQAAGTRDFNDVKTAEEAVRKLLKGVKGSGALKGKVFACMPVAELPAADVALHLRFDVDQRSLRYNPKSLSLKGYDFSMESFKHLALLVTPQQPAPSSSPTGGSIATQHRAPTVNDLHEANSAAHAALAMRTAQQLASVFNAAMATGAKELDDVKTTEEAIQRIITGVEGGGAFKGKQFVAKANAMHVESARAYLRYDANEKILRYSSTGGSSAPRGNEARSQVMSVGHEIRQSAPSSVEDIREAHEAAKAALAMRNAQSFASVFNAAMAACSTELDDVRTVDDAMKRMIAGVEGGGPFKGRRFQMPATPEEAAAAKPYLKYDLDQKALFYASRTANTGFMDNRQRPSAMPVTSDTPAATTARRNAELFCAVFNAAMVAGAPELESVRTVDDAIKRIMAGVHGGGVFKGKLFVVDASPEQAAAAKRHLEFRQEDQMLIFNP